ncbi:MAG TPA: plastocyanin/azurin family copper-binding protein [Candidatus Baltobacteraceae bacterium]|nr:plastocyanin/azurin family copper-binding protein [Candidatus Baltobacteraceae bacterium]
MKRLLSIASILLLVGAGCAVGQQADFQAQTPPAAEPAQPAQPATGTGTSAQPAQPANPPSDEIKAEIDANLSLRASVAINAGGAFSPATITVKKGTTVTWTNEGSAKVWIASDPHPVHDGYPGLDSGTDIGTGASYSFTFEKTGSWGYHNHLNPLVKGTVIVTE